MHACDPNASAGRHVRMGRPIASVIERGWQGNYFLGVGDVRAPHGGGVRGHAVGSNRLRTANQRSTLPVFGANTLHVDINACATGRHACGCDVSPIAAATSQLTPGAVIATTH